METNSNNQNNNMETMSNNQTINNMETKKSNNQQFSSAHPGLIAYVIDQSGSMSESYPEGGTKAKFTQLAVSSAINETINANFDGETPKDRANISLIGFGKSVQEIRTDKLSEFANNPYRIESGTKKVSDGNGGLVEVAVQNPVYFEPVADGLTPLAEALGVVKQVFIRIKEKYPESPDSVAILVTDGMPRSEGVADAVEEANAIALAEEIKAMGGLIFGCHIGNGRNKCEFPVTEDELPDDQAKFIYKVCSIVPESYKEAARKLELNVSENSRAMVTNADPTTFVKFINFGSSGTNQDRLSN
jgi:hypothetical protein